jgi:hypothetical protein
MTASACPLILPSVYGFSFTIYRSYIKPPQLLAIRSAVWSKMDIGIKGGTVGRDANYATVSIGTARDRPSQLRPQRPPTLGPFLAALAPRTSACILGLLGAREIANDRVSTGHNPWGVAKRRSLHYGVRANHCDDCRQVVPLPNQQREKTLANHRAFLFRIISLVISQGDRRKSFATRLC